MEEAITVDGKQFILTTDIPLTAGQKEQAIAEIRRQSGCGCGNKMANVGGEIQTLLASQCASVTMLAPANITITDIKIGSVDCTTPGFTCTPDTIQCTNVGCTPPNSVSVVVTWANSGDVSGTFIPTLTVTPPSPGTSTSYTGTSTTVPAQTPGTPPTPGTATTTFSAVSLARGSNNVCVNSGTIT